MNEEIFEGLNSYVVSLRDAVDMSEGSADLHRRYMEALEMEEKIHKDEMDAYDKEQRREMENEKNKTMAGVELSKQRLTPGRVALEMAKVVVPALIGAGSLFVGLSFANDIEKDGRINTKFSNLVLNQIPKIWNGK